MKESLLNFLIEIVKEASTLTDGEFSTSQKGSKDDLITNLDLEIEEFLIKKIGEKYPDFTFK